MRPFALLAAGSLLAAALAGCAGAGPGSAARDAYPSARDRAAAWDPDAVLVAVIALEARDAENVTRRIEEDTAGMAAQEPAAAPYVRAIVGLVRAVVADGDGAPGDGFAPAWGHMFVSGKGVRAVVVDHAGSVTYDQDFVVPGVPGAKVTGARGLDGAWAVDSDEAARIARENNTAYAALLDEPDAMASMELSLEDGGPVWAISIGRFGERWASVRVDAMTGEILSAYPRGTPEQPGGPGGPGAPSRGPPPPPPEPGQEADAISGRLAAVLADRAEAGFEIRQDGHGAMRLVLEAVDALGPVRLRATVTDPEGREHEVVAGGVGTGTRLSGAQDVWDVPAGAWQVEIALEQGAVQDYRFSWCTDGRPAGDSDASGNPACEGVGERLAGHFRLAGLTTG